MEENTQLVNEKYLETYWRFLMGEDGDVDFYISQLKFIEAFKAAISLDAGENGLYLKKNVWNIAINPDVLQNIITIPAVVGILNYFKMTGLASVAVPMVFQGLFKIQNFKISIKDEMIFLRLPLMEDNEYKTAQQLYKSLPKTVRKKVGEYDFYDTIDNFIKVGLAKERNGEYLIQEKGQTKVQFSFLPR